MHTKNHKRRIPDIPACRQASIVSTDRDLGPSVPTILVNNGLELCKLLQTALNRSPLKPKNLFMHELMDTTIIFTHSSKYIFIFIFI